MRLDPTNTPAKLLGWEESAKLKSAQKLQDHFAKKGLQPPADYGPQIRFAAQHTERVETLRTTYWPDGKGEGRHPLRWTGRDLGQDAVEATRLLPAGYLDEFYATRYQQLCWDTHGSGLTSVRLLSADDFPALWALALSDCVGFALIVAEHGG